MFVPNFASLQTINLKARENSSFRLISFDNTISVAIREEPCTLTTLNLLGVTTVEINHGREVTHGRQPRSRTRPRENSTELLVRD